MNALIAISWRPRGLPLDPVGVAALGPVASRLGRRVLAFDNQRLERLRGAASRGVLFLFGAFDDLPWVDGVVYLGNDREAHGLIVPTTLEPSVPALLLERALSERFGAPPLVVLADPPMVFEAGRARSVDRARLLAWLDKEA